MAKVSVDTTRLSKKLKAISKEFVLTDVGDVIRKEVIESIERGVSPVQGQGRFVKYSESYREQIRRGSSTGKRVRPVNLKVTGELLKSLRVSVSNKLRKITIAFTDAKAVYHNSGTDKIPARRMLPTRSGERFNGSIQNEIFKALKRSLGRVIQKFR